ncbi:MAG: tetratricopeptide repeat protein [Fuerstiella sp.]|nr:tetratricopeptide repeat protein [Fuerstiella sp.]
MKWRGVYAHKACPFAALSGPVYRKESPALPCQITSLGMGILSCIVLWVAGMPTCAAQETEVATRQYAVAVGFQNQKLFDSAIDEWQTFLKKFPNDPRVGRGQHYLGTCCLQEKRYTDAIAAFTTVVTKYPELPLMDQSMMNLGIALYGNAQQSQKNSDYIKAEQAFAAMLTKYEDSQYSARAMYYRGECLFQLERTEDAAAAYAEFLQKHPKHEFSADANYALGTAQEMLNQSAKARTTYANFTSRYPQHALLTEVQMRHAELLFDGNQFAQALPIFESVTGNREFALADVAMLRHARCLYEQGRIDEAARLYWNVPREFKQTKHYDAAILAGAKCYFLEEKFKLARTGFERLADRNVPEAAEATQWLARTHLKENNAAMAREVAERGLRRFRGDAYRPELELVHIDALYEIPERKKNIADLYADFVRRNVQHELAPQAQYMAALAALDNQDYAAAARYCKTFLSDYSSDSLKPDVLFISAESQLLLGQHENAEQRYGEFLRLASDHGNAQQARVRRGVALYMEGRYADAVAWLQPLVSHFSDSGLKSEALSLVGRSQLALKKIASAKDSLLNAVRTDPGHPQTDETIMALADAYNQLDQPDAAKQQWQTVLTQYPDSPLLSEATYRIAEAAFAAERFDDAVKKYADVAQNWPDSDFAPHAQYGLGWTWFSVGEYRKASTAMTTLVDRYKAASVRAQGLYVRAMAAYQLGEYPAAITDVQSFLATKPKPGDALDAQYVMGLAQAGLKQFEAATKTYTSILASADSYATADKVAYELGWAWIELGKTDEAVAVFQRLAKDWPDSPLAAESLFRAGEAYYDAADFARAAAAYQESAQQATTTEIGEKSLHKLGWSCLKSEDIAAAIKAFASQLTQHPNGELAADARFLTGECHFRREDWPAARAAYENVIASRDSSYVALAMFHAGECAASLEDWNSSRRLHQQVLAEFPDFEMRPEARYGVAWALQNEGQLNNAIAAYEQVTEESNTETAAKARFMIGECCFAQKKHKDATKHFLKTVFLYNHPEWSAMAYFEAGRCFEVLRDTDQAENCYQQVIAKYPQHAKVKDARRRLMALNGT